MKFRIKLKSRLFYLTFIGLFFYIIYRARAISTLLSVSQSVEISIIAGLVILVSIYVLLFDETYTINGGDLIIKKGRRVTTLRIADINHIYYKTFDNTGRHKLAININEAHLVVGDKKISINTDAKNNRDNSLVDILTNKYGKRLIYDNSLTK